MAVCDESGRGLPALVLLYRALRWVKTPRLEQCLGYFSKLDLPLGDMRDTVKETETWSIVFHKFNLKRWDIC